MERVKGILTIRAATYRALAQDPRATRSAGLVVAAVWLVVGFVEGLVFRWGPNWQAHLVVAVLVAVVAVGFGLVGWIVSGAILAWVAKRFGGRTNVREMLRVTGYVELFRLANVLDLLQLAGAGFTFVAGLLLPVVGIMHVLGYVVGVREAAQVSTGNAIVTAIVASIINILIVIAFLIAAAAVGVAILGSSGT